MNDVLEENMIRLRPGAVDCNANGLKLGGHDLLDREHGKRARPKYILPSIGMLETRLRRSYGRDISGAGKLSGLQVVVDALNKGDLAQAQIATLLLKLPDPGDYSHSTPALLKRLHDNGWVVKDWDPDKHPRTGTPPNPGWFAATDGGSADSANASPISSTQAAPNGELKPSEATSRSGGEQQFAVLTTNFKYACKALRLDPYAASEILHQLKEDANVGPADDCTFDTETGDVFFNGEHIGNLTE